MKTLVGKFSFKIPALPEGSTLDRPDAGKKVENAFNYQETESEQEAVEVLASKKWSLKDLVDEALKTNARAAAYQTALAPYKVDDDFDPEKARQKMVNLYIQMYQVTPEVAAAQVDKLLNEQK